MSKRSMEEKVIWLAVIVGGGYLLYRLLNQTPNTAATTPAIAAPPNVQASLNTALTNLATGATELFS